MCGICTRSYGEGKHREETGMSKDHKIRRHEASANPHLASVVDYDLDSLPVREGSVSEKWEQNGADDDEYKSCLILMMNAMACSMRRGPHHPHGQTPVEHQHHHYKPRGSDSLTSDTRLLHDTKHIEEDSSILTQEALSKMTPEELEFHYFSAHDFDRNSKLDGLELLKAIYHTLEHESPDPDENPVIEPEADELDGYIALVDKTLATDDTDGDGCVSYAEYRAARENKGPDRTPRVVLTP